LRRLN